MTKIYTVKDLLSEFDKACPKCSGKGNGGDGCSYCWSHDVEKTAIDQVLKQLATLINDEVIGQPIEYKKLSMCTVCNYFMYSCNCATAQEILVNEQCNKLKTLLGDVNG